MALSFTQISATTLKNYLPTLVNNVMDSNAFISRLRERGNVILDGGDTLVQPVKYSKSTAVQSFTGYDTLNITPQNNFTAAEYQWAFYNVSITYSDEEIAKNSGKSRAVNLIDAKIMEAENDLVSALNTDLYLDGTGNGGKNILGLAIHVADDPTSGTLGGIDRALYTWWRNVTDAATAGWGSLTNQYGREDFDANFLATRRGKDYVDLAVAGPTAFKLFKKEFQANEQSNADFKEIKGFGAIDLQYNKVDVCYDEICTTNKMYLLNTKYMKLAINKNYNFKVIPAIRPTNQAAFVQHIRVCLQLIGSNPSKNAVIHSIS